GADARPYAVLAARRFSRAALIVMLLLMASGVLNAIAQVESVAALAGTTHGRLLLAKLAVLVPILVLAAVNRTRILPALSAPSLVRRRRVPVLAGGLALVAIGAGVGIFPLVVDAYPTTYKRPLPTYHVASIASGMTIYREHCVGCHGTTGTGGPLVDLRSPPTSRRHAGEIFWLIRRGLPERGMPDFGIRLGEAQPWRVNKS